MYKILLILITLYSYCISAQNGKAYYKVYTVSKDKSVKLIKDLEFELIFSNDEYIFKKSETMNSDGTSLKNKIINRRAEVGVFYRNIKEDLKFVKMDFLGFPIIRKDTLLEKHWNLTNKSKIISNYNCKNANIVTRNEYNGAEFYTEAWYNPDLSLPFGPNGFDGLPGLIISLESLNLRYVLDRIEFSDKAMKISKPKGKPMTNDDIISFMAEKTGANEGDLKKYFSTINSKK